VAFAVEKGGVVDLPQTLDSITVGLGWDTDMGDVDLDVSAVLLNKDCSCLETVFFGRLESDEHGIKHSGDNLTGEGDGDDERIQVSLSRVGPQVHYICFVINIYTPKTTFRQVANPYCRVVEDAWNNELCRFALRETGKENGLIPAKLAREVGGRWGFHALGIPCHGRTYKDSLPAIEKACRTATKSLMERGGTTDFSSVSGSHTATHHVMGTVVEEPPPESRGTAKGSKNKSNDCTLQ